MPKYTSENEIQFDCYEQNCKAKICVKMKDGEFYFNDNIRGVHHRCFTKIGEDEKFIILDLEFDREVRYSKEKEKTIDEAGYFRNSVIGVGVYNLI